MERDELHLEFALARQVLQIALGMAARVGWPKGKESDGDWRASADGADLAGGGVLSPSAAPGLCRAGAAGFAAATGITTLVLDPHSLTPALGAAAAVLADGHRACHGVGQASRQSGHRGFPDGRGRAGRAVARVKLEREGQAALEGEVRLGQLVVLPLGPGEVGRLTLRPERGFDVGLGGPGGPGR